MLHPRGSTCSALALGLALAACTSPPSVSDAGHAAVDAARPPIVLSGAFVASGTGDPVPGVQVCVEPSDVPCVRTNAVGVFAIEGVPFDSELQVIGGADDASLIALAVSARTRDVSRDIGVFSLVPRARVDVVFADSGTTWDGVSAIVAVDVVVGRYLLPYGWWIEGLAGARASLDPSHPPLYARTDGTLDETLAATTRRGTALFVGAPESGEIVIDAPFAHCVRDDDAWPGSSELALRFRAIPGAVTYAGRARCVVP